MAKFIKKKGGTKMKRFFSVVLTFVFIMTFVQTGMVFGAENIVTITSPAESAVVDRTLAINVTGTLTSGYENAEIYIDDTSVKVLDTDLSSYSESIDVSNFNNGRHMLKVKVEYANGTEEAFRELIFTESYNKTIVDGLNSSSYGATAVNFWTQRSQWAGTYPIADGVMTYTNSTTTPEYFRVGFEVAPYITEGVYSFEMEVAFGGVDSNTDLKISARRDGGYYPVDEYVIKDGVLMSTQEEIKPDEYHKVKVELFVTGVVYNYAKIYIDDDLYKEGSTGNISALSPLTSVFLEVPTPSAVSPYSYMFKNAKFKKLGLEMPYVETLSYNIGSVSVDEDEWDGGKLFSLADSVSVGFNNVLDSANINSTNVILKKKDGTPVEASVVPVDNNVKITPKNGFETNTEYKVVLSNMSYDSITFAKPIEVCFASDLEFGIVYPSNGLAIQDKETVELTAAVPGEPTGVRFILDGIERTATGSNGIYTSSVEFQQMNLGEHNFTVEATYADGTKTDTTYFEIVRNLSPNIFEGKGLSHSTVVSISNCEGSDGEENGGFTVTAAANTDTPSNGFFFYQGFNVTSGVVMLDFDIKRGENTGFDFETQYRNGNDQWQASGRFGVVSPLITMDGILGGTSTVIPAGEWHNIKILEDISTGYSELFLDGEFISSGTNTSRVKPLTNVKFNVTGSSDKTWTASFDNISFAMYGPSPRRTDASYQLETDGDYTSVIDNTVSTLSKKIKLTMSQAFDVAPAAADITVNGIQASAVEVSGNDITVTVPDGAMDTSSDTVIEFASTLAIDGNALGTPLDIRLKTKVDVVDNIGAISIEKDADSASASITFTKGTLSSNYGDSVCMIIASYNDDMLMALNVETKSISKGLNPLSISLSDLNGGTKVKAFLWESESDIRPLTLSVEK